MPNILLTRIDNRLIYGQVGVTWVRSLGANLIVVANDDVSKDPLQQKLMSITADNSGAGTRFFSLEKTIEIIHKASASQKIFLVVRDIQDTRKLIEGGVPIMELNLGNLHFSEGKKEFSKKVYLDEQDIIDLDFIKSKGVKIYAQNVPNDKIKNY